MYEGKYISPATKFNLQSQRKMQHRHQGRSCGYYMRIAFFFTSLIQSLIIVGLVLFLVYGKSQDSASESRIKDLEKSFSQLSLENMALKQDKKNLTKQLNVTMTQKIKEYKELMVLRLLAGNSYLILNGLNMKLAECKAEVMRSKTQCPPLIPGTRVVTVNTNNNDNKHQQEQLSKMLALEKTNFTQTTQMLKIEMEQMAKERDNLHLDAINLRREKLTLERTLESYTRKCKEDFASSLSGITDVSRAFLGKIESLFPQHIPFQLTCEKQRDNLEQIRTNCTSLSREVEDRFQRYLDSVGAEVSQIQGRSSRLEADNLKLTEEQRWCSQNRTGMIWEHAQKVKKLQEKHDNEKEKMLKEQLRMRGEKELLESSLQVKEANINILNDKIKNLNASKANCGSFPGGSNSLFGQASSSRTNSGPNTFGGGSTFGRTGTGSSSFGSNGLGSTSFGLGSTGQGGPSLGAGKTPGLTGLGTGTGGLGTGIPSSPALGTVGIGTGLGSAGKTGSAGTNLGSPSLGSSGMGTGAVSTGSGTRGSIGSVATGGLNTGVFGNTGAGSSLGVGSKGPGLPGGTGFGTGSATGTGGTGFGTGGSTGTGLGSNPFGGVGLGNKGTTGTGGTGFGTGSATGTGLGSNPFGGVGLGNRGTTGTGGIGFGTGSATGTGGTGFGTGGSTGTGLGSNTFGGVGLGNRGTTGTGGAGFGTGGSSGPGLGSSSFGGGGFGNRGVGGGTSMGGTGSSFNAGGVNTLNIDKHLQELRRYSTPPGSPTSG